MSHLNLKITMPEDWLQRFEQKLEQLEQSAGEENASFSDVLNTAESGLKCLADLEKTTLWLVRPDAVECLSGNTETGTGDQEHQRIRDACHRESSTVDADSGFQQLFVTRPVAVQMTCVLQVRYQNKVSPRPGFVEGALAVLDVLVGFVSRHLLSRYETRFQTQVTMVELVSRLHRCCTFREAASVVVQDGAPVIGDCRLSVIASQADTHHVVAVTGVKEPRPESETVRALTQVVANYQKKGARG